MNTTSDTPDMQESAEPSRERASGIYWFLLLISLVLLGLVPLEVPWVNSSRGWYTQPMLGSLLGLSVLAIFSLVRVLQSLKGFRTTPIGRGENIVEDVFETLDSCRTALVASGLFFCYIQLLELFGFMLTTLLFVTTLLWMSRLLNRTWFIASLFTLAALILIFRFILHVWLPDVWLYSLLPEPLSDFANQYL